jgi:hypothetical protein
MEAQKIKDYIKGTMLPSVMRQIPTNEDLTHSILTITVKIDLLRTLKQAKEIGTFIIGDFIEFNHLLESSILEVMEDSGRKVPKYGVKLVFNIHNCSLPRHNLEST